MYSEKKYLISCMILILFHLTVFTQYIEVQTGVEYTQDFNLLGTEAEASLPEGWLVDKLTSLRTVGSIFEAITNTERIGGNNLATNAANGIYNFGAGPANSATDRSIGWLASGTDTRSGNLYARFINNGEDEFLGFDISYVIEKFRQGSNEEGFAIQMYFSFDGENFYNAGDDFYFAFEPDIDNSGYNNAPGETENIEGYLFAGPVKPDNKVYLAWNYSVSSGTTTSNAQALSINNVSLTPSDKTYFHAVAGQEGAELENSLHEMISLNTNSNYDNSRQQMFGYIDNFNNQVRCVYTGDWYNVPEGGMPDPTELNAEHLYPQSWFDSHPEQSIARSDLHALAPTFPAANNSRSNHPIDYVETIISTWGSDGYFSYYGTNEDGYSAFEVADEFKGNTSRALLYFSVRYYDYFDQRFGEADWNVEPFFRGNVDMLNSLLLWHIADPVDDVEMQRTQEVFLYQGNRNPFIDHPEFVSEIWGPIFPPAPVALEAEQITANSFTAEWEPVHASTEYRLDVSSSSNFSSFLPGYEDLPISGTSYEVTGLSSNSLYFFRVRAVHENADGPSEDSNTITVTTLSEDAQTFVETFDNHNLSGTAYASGSFIGNYDIEWFYEGARDESSYPIEGKGIILGSAGDNSRVYADLAGGIRNFSIEMRKAFTASGARQIELFIDNVSFGTSIQFGEESGEDITIHSFEVDNINIQGDFRIEIRNILGTSSNRRQLTIDNITWTDYEPQTSVTNWMFY